MRQVPLITTVFLLLLLQGVAVSHAQATSLEYGVSRIGGHTDEGLGRQFNMQLNERSGEVLLMRSSLGVPASVADVYLDDPHAQSGDGGAGSFDGLVAAFVDGRFKAGQHVQSAAMTGQSSSSITQSTPVPLPAAAWLFASALLGFVVVASRRKV